MLPLQFTQLNHTLRWSPKNRNRSIYKVTLTGYSCFVVIKYFTKRQLRHLYVVLFHHTARLFSGLAK